MDWLWHRLAGTEQWLQNCAKFYTRRDIMQDIYIYTKITYCTPFWYFSLFFSLSNKITLIISFSVHHTIRGECPRGPASSISLTIHFKVMHGCVVKNLMGDFPDERLKQLTLPSFRRDLKPGVPCLDAACIVGLN